MGRHRRGDCAGRVLRLPPELDDLPREPRARNRTAHGCAVSDRVQFGQRAAVARRVEDCVPRADSESRRTLDPFARAG